MSDFGFRFAAFVITAATLASTPLQAGSSSATMHVSATVVGRAVVAVDSRPVVEVTEADLDRGYVDVAEPLRIRVRTNSRNGYVFQAHKTGDSFAAVELAFGNTTMTVAEQSWVTRPPVDGADLMSVRVRVRLAPGTPAGRHPLPVQFSASTL